MPPLEPRIQFANELDAHAVQWLWPLRIPRGVITLLVGDPGLGKSLRAFPIHLCQSAKSADASV